MKAVLLGGSGFVGSHLAATLNAADHTVWNCDERPPARESGAWAARLVAADIYNVPDPLLLETMQGADVVYHLAWRHLPAASNVHVEDEARENVPGTLRLLRLCLDAGVRRVVFFSSGGNVYGPAQRLPIDENHPTEPLSAHAVSKLAVEKYLRLYAHLHSLDYVILRPGNPYGPFQNPDGGQGVLAAFLARAAAGREIEVWGDGSTLRDYFWVGDLARAALLAATTPHSRTVYNIGSGEGRTVDELIAAIEQMLGRRLVIVRRPGRTSDVPANVLDIDKAARLLGWRPEVTFEDGLRRAWEWYAAR
jgi:UDP-glucose 4-epimerase